MATWIEGTVAAPSFSIPVHGGVLVFRSDRLIWSEGVVSKNDTYQVRFSSTWTLGSFTARWGGAARNISIRKLPNREKRIYYWHQ